MFRNTFKFGVAAAIALCSPGMHSSAFAAQGNAMAADQVRHINVNGQPLSTQGLAQLEKVEQANHFHVTDGDYWYDRQIGVAGRWGGPALAMLPPGLDLGGPMPANCSGGGTGVFVNGRELHMLDALAVQKFFGQVIPGRYWMDAHGNVGFEGQRALFNLYVLAYAVQAQAQASGQSGGGGGGGGVYRQGYGNYSIQVGPINNGGMISSRIGSKTADWWPGK
jgi:hypothetical protein